MFTFFVLYISMRSVTFILEKSKLDNGCRAADSMRVSTPETAETLVPDTRLSRLSTMTLSWHQTIDNGQCQLRGLPARACSQAQLWDTNINFKTFLWSLSHLIFEVCRHWDAGLAANHIAGITVASQHGDTSTLPSNQVTWPLQGHYYWLGWTFRPSLAHAIILAENKYIKRKFRI